MRGLIVMTKNWRLWIGTLQPSAIAIEGPKADDLTFGALMEPGNVELSVEKGRLILYFQRPP
jgi:hypothetical protein